MGKAPAFQFYVKDWLSDPALQSASSSSRGIWINALCYMWENVTQNVTLGGRGKLIGKIEELAKLLRASNGEFSAFLEEANRLKFADVTICNNEVTIINRRMMREQKERENTRLRVKKFRSNVKSNLNVTPPSPSPSPISKKKIKDSSSYSDTRKFLTHYSIRFKDHFGKDPVIEWGKDSTIIKNLLKFITIDTLKELLERYFTSEDKFILKSGYTIGIFKTQINKLQIGEPLNGTGLWLKAKEKEDERKGQKEIRLIDEKTKGDIPDRDGR